jgi:hypothetical protein
MATTVGYPTWFHRWMRISLKTGELGAPINPLQKAAGFEIRGHCLFNNGGRAPVADHTASNTMRLPTEAVYSR